MSRTAFQWGTYYAHKVLFIKAWVCWRSAFLRRQMYKRLVADPKVRFEPIKKFIEGFNAFSKVSIVKCESCDAIGLDYRSEKYGWYYHGYHIWSCPDCKE